MQTNTSLASSLAALRDKYAALLKPSLTAVMDGHIEQLRATGFVKGAKSEGDRMPSFVLKDQDGNTVSSADLLKRGPLVVSFFRGTWCPYCVAELRALSDYADEIVKAGGSIVTISPQSPEQQDAEVLAGIRFPVLYDRDNAVGKQFGLVYDFPEDLKKLYQDVFKNDISVQNGVEAWQLPIPARYVVTRDGDIVDAQIDPDYRYRPEPLVTLSVLKQYA
jgi:peroxiredoxin